MNKSTYYNDTLLYSYEIDGVPHADMSQLLESVVPDGWGDYAQVLNSGMDLIQDLEIKCVDGVWVIPIYNVSNWFYSFAIRNKKSSIYETFRIYRRDVETSLRVTWAMPVNSVSLKECNIPFTDTGTNNSVNLFNIFTSFGIRDTELYTNGYLEDLSLISYIEMVAAGTSCGSRGQLLVDQIQYIEMLPNGESILETIDEELRINMPEPTGYLDDYLDLLNSTISLTASKFIGEL